MKIGLLIISLFIIGSYFQVNAEQISSNKNYSVFLDLYKLRSQISDTAIIKDSVHYKDTWSLNKIRESQSFYDLGHLISSNDMTFVPRYCSTKYGKNYGSGDINTNICEDKRAYNLQILMQYLESIIYKISKTQKGKEILLKLVNNNPRRFVETLGFDPIESEYFRLTTQELNLKSLMDNRHQNLKHQANDYIRGIRSYSFILKPDDKHFFDSWTDNLESTYFIITPTFFNRKNITYDELLVRMMIHELSISADGKSEIDFTDFASKFSTYSQCNAYSAVLNPYIRIASAQLRAFYDEEQILYEMGFLKKYKTAAKSLGTCLDNLKFSLKFLNVDKQWIKDELKQRSDILIENHCPVTENTFNMDTATNTLKNVKGLCHYLTNNNYYSTPDKRSHNWSKGPRPRIGDGGGVKIDIEEKP